MDTEEQGITPAVDNSINEPQITPFPAEPTKPPNEEKEPELAGEKIRDREVSAAQIEAIRNIIRQRRGETDEAWSERVDTEAKKRIAEREVARKAQLAEDEREITVMRHRIEEGRAIFNKALETLKGIDLTEPEVYGPLVAVTLGALSIITGHQELNTASAAVQIASAAASSGEGAEARMLGALGATVGAYLATKGIEHTGASQHLAEAVGNADVFADLGELGALGANVIGKLKK